MKGRKYLRGRIIALLGTGTDHEIAKATGASTRFVSNVRCKLGVPRVESEFDSLWTALRDDDKGIRRLEWEEFKEIRREIWRRATQIRKQRESGMEEVLEVLKQRDIWRLAKCRTVGGLYDGEVRTWVQIQLSDGRWVFPDCSYQCQKCQQCLGCLRKVIHGNWDLGSEDDDLFVCVDGEGHDP